MDVVATKTFIKSAKAIAKKYRSFNSDYQKLIKDLSENPKLGIDLGSGYRKIRMSTASKGRGKSGGCRVITFGLVEKNNVLYLLYIYDKSEHENIDLSIIKVLCQESIDGYELSQSE